MQDLQQALSALLNQLDRYGVGQTWDEYIDARRVLDESLKDREDD